ncbi:zinc-binding dehydrogenase [Actinotalea sp. M2MS4P-6]|uniref:zinc-dependent alcohol dehydrogenase n=1 Tax=Actinotalea sp. M2MS4P-6 TaxID=2983762 RepID=UPI0021E4FC30|nr:zinc-binding dehydrogenase [Actinotalea sp. M2MS4P-6]MCV2394296.1 zinc-binding dehydrogenase [Actinotalea sp. M2MS4P-6]
MKSLQYDGVGAVALVDRPVPTAGPGEVLVRISLCGMCGTDVHAYRQEGILFPGTVLGHESVGVVEQVGAGVAGFAVGDRVAIGAPGSCPEGCYYCRIGRPTLCVNAFERTPGIGPGTQGAFAEYVLARYPQRQLVPVPAAVSDEQAVLFDIYSTAWHGLRRSSFQAGMNVAVVGAGAIGLSMVQLLRAAGAGHITAVNRSAKKRELALAMGADLALSPTEEDDLAARVKDLYGGLGADIVYECAGSAATVGIAMQLVRSAGEVIVVGTSPEPLDTINGIQVQLFEIDLKGSFAYTDDEIRTVFRFMERGMLHTDGMLERIVPLAEADVALAELAATSQPVRWAVRP